MDDEESDTFKVFIATDNHLGYLEEDTIRGEDSFNTFEEILMLSKEEKADMLLLGGDLFHHNKPSRPTMYRTMNLFRKYCQGGGPINFRIVSDQSRNFPDYGVVNFEDPNINVELPVFSIHGNHDDPVRDGFTKALSSLDLLSCARLINYFGQTDRVDDIEVFPILMMKGKTKVAIYGLGNVRDERLNRMFAQKKVKFRRPAEWQDEWFSIFVVHQNRDNKGRGSKNCIHENFIPEFIDFVLWGHEHECLAETTESLRGKFVITQPGSSVATSLVEGEAREKKVGLLEIRGGDFRWTLKTLKTVRPFIFEEIVLSEQDELDPNDPKISAKVSQFLSDRVRSIIASNYDKTQQILVRLRIEYTGFVTLHNQQFGSQFIEQVANPDCILQFHKTRKYVAKSQKEDGGIAMDVRDAVQSLPNADAVCVETLISQVLQKSQNKLELVPENDMNIALESYVYKGMSSSVEETILGILESTQEELSKVKEASTSGDIIQLVEKTMGKLSVQATAPSRQQRQVAVPDVFQGVSKDKIQVLADGQDMFDSIPETTSTSTKPPVKRRTISRKKKVVLEEEEEEESEEDFCMGSSEEEEKKPKRTTAKRKASAATVEKSTPKKRKPPVRKRAEKENVGRKTRQSTIMSGFESQQSQSKRKLPGFISSQRSAIEVEEIDESD